MPGTNKLNLRFERIRRPNAKLVIPSAGVFAFYAGGLLGLWLSTLGKTAPGRLTMMFATFAVGTILGFGVMTAVDTALGEEASHVDIIKTVLWMTGAWFCVMLERQLAEWLGFALPQFIENLVIWGAGVASIWEEEPGFPGWPAIREQALQRLRRR